MALPDRTAVRAYLGTTVTVSDETLDSALAAETQAQARAITVPADPGADIGEALCRRVARNLAMRGLPLGVLADELGSVRVGSNDPEVRRLEAPYRRVVLG